MDVEVPRSWNGDPAQVNAALVGPKRGGQTTSIKSLGATGNQRPRTVEVGTSYKRPMSSGGLQSVEVMMMSGQKRKPRQIRADAAVETISFRQS
ncbi:jg9756 [Pararge aegeria aegeria]|uniref:Jg9756 protein n=1 Tax=Pararge aegeria aegeria TaxID=348720 RepID=A0A8S4RN66_9NEOP|nr:jg9756 [Pararge aegeria aegeria]